MTKPTPALRWPFSQWLPLFMRILKADSGGKEGVCAGGSAAPAARGANPLGLQGMEEEMRHFGITGAAGR